MSMPISPVFLFSSYKASKSIRPSFILAPRRPAVSCDIRVRYLTPRTSSLLRHTIDSVIATGKDAVVLMHPSGALRGSEALKGSCLTQDEEDVSETVMGAKDKIARKGHVLDSVFVAGAPKPEGGTPSNSEKDKTLLPGFAR